MAKVSVIVPVYNTEKYLPQCLDSVINQSLQDIEIICVNDGSTDHSLEILQQYELSDKRVIVYSQPNSYAGIARNTGMKHANGEYLFFLDSDDYIAPDALEKMYCQAETDLADICVCGGKNFFEDTGKEMLFDGLLDMKLVPSMIPFSLETWPQYILNFTNVGVWNKLYRREFIIQKDLHFTNLKRGEDIGFVIPALCLADRISVVNDFLVVYRAFRTDGLTTTGDESVKEILNAWIDTANVLKEKNRFPKQSFDNRALKSILGVLRNIGSWDVFCSAVEQLKTSVLSRLDLTKREEGYYYVPWQEEMLGHLLEKKAGEFALLYIRMMNIRLLDKTTSKRKQSETFNEKEKKYKEKITDANEVNRKLKEKNKLLSEKNNKLREINDSLCEKNKQLIGDNKRLEKQLDTLENSWAYKIGKAVTFVPGEIKGFFQRTKYKHP